MEHRQIATKAEQNESRPWRHYATTIEVHVAFEDSNGDRFFPFLENSFRILAPHACLTLQLITGKVAYNFQKSIQRPSTRTYRVFQQC